MPTKLTKPVVRVVPPSKFEAALVVELKPGGMLSFRKPGKRTSYEISVYQCKVLAMCQHLASQYAIELERWKGKLRRTKPKPPNFAMFSRSLRTALRQSC